MSGKDEDVEESSEAERVEAARERVINAAGAVVFALAEAGDTDYPEGSVAHELLIAWGEYICLASEAGLI